MGASEEEGDTAFQFERVCRLSAMVSKQCASLFLSCSFRALLAPHTPSLFTSSQGSLRDTTGDLNSMAMGQDRFAHCIISLRVEALLNHVCVYTQHSLVFSPLVTCDARLSDSAITGSAVVNRRGAPIAKGSSDENMGGEESSEEDVSDSSR